jgi:hypothetical protein
MIADAAVTTAKIADANVTTAKLVDANVTPAKLSQPITLGTAQASTSGTAITFSSIPSWVKRVTIMFNSVSTSGTSSWLVQLGAGSVTSTGYTSMGSQQGATNTVTATNSTAGMVIYSANASNVLSGHMVLTTVGSNIWVASHVMGDYITGYYSNAGGGSVALAGTLDRVVITTVNGTDTFDAGYLNIIYE